jgi:hypothetical protein
MVRITTHSLFGAAFLLVSACGDDDSFVTSETDGTGTESGPTTNDATTLTTASTTMQTTTPDDTTGVDDTTDDDDTTTGVDDTTTDHDDATGTTGTTGTTGDEETGTTGDEATGTTGDEATGTTGDEETGTTGDEYVVPGCVDEDLFDEVPVVVQGSNLGFGNNHSGTCGGTMSEDYVLEWQAPANGVYIFNTTDSDFDTVLYLRDAGETCGGEEIACHDDVWDTATSAIATQLDAGDRIQLFVDGDGGGIAGDFTLLIEEPAPADCCTAHGDLGCEQDDVTLCVCAADPACCGMEWDEQCAFVAQFTCGEDCGIVLPPGDTCEDPHVVDPDDLPYVHAGTTVDNDNNYAFSADSCPGVSAGRGNGSNDAVYAFTPNEGGFYEFNVDPQFDAVVYVVTDCAGIDGSCQAAHDVAGAVPVGVELELDAGTTYYAIVDGWSNVSNVQGDYTITIDQVEQVEPGAGNTCTDPLPLANGTYSWEGATNEFTTGGSNGCTGWSANGVDRVHVVTLASGETLTVTLTASSGDPSIYLITDCAEPETTCVEGSDVIGAVETLEYTSVSGGTYYFIADRFTSGATTATYTLDVTIE